MAPSRPTKRQRAIASTHSSSVPATSDRTSPLSDSKNLNDNRESSSTGHELDKTDDHRSQEPAAPASPIYRKISGVFVLQTFDPDTYDPDGRMPGTPEPDPYDPETYTTWGRKRFGEDWYEQRKIMLQERNIYMHRDPVYLRRQRALRVLERQIERRPLDPRRGDYSWADIDDEGWKRLWPRISKDLPLMDTPSPPETPEKPTWPWDPWEKLEYDRRHLRWDRERYQFERFYLKENLKDNARDKRENEGGDKKAREELDEILMLRRTAPSFEEEKDRWTRVINEYEHRMDHYNLRRRGLTQDQIDVMDRDRSEHHIQEEHHKLRAKGWTQEQIDVWHRAEHALREWEERNRPADLEDFRKMLRQAEGDAYNAWWEGQSAAMLRINVGVLPKGSGLGGIPIDKYEEEVREIWRRNIGVRMHNHLRGKGWTQEQIEAADRADSRLTAWHRKTPFPAQVYALHKWYEPITQEARDMDDAWRQKEATAIVCIYREPPPMKLHPFGGCGSQEEEDAYDAWRRNIRTRVHNHLRSKGWTQEQIETADQADAALEEWQRTNPPPRGLSVFCFLGVPTNSEERDLYNGWVGKKNATIIDHYGELPPKAMNPFGEYTTQGEEDACDAWRRKIHARISSRHDPGPDSGASTTADATATKKVSRPPAPKSEATKQTSRRTRSGRIKKNAAQSESVTSGGPGSRRSAPTAPKKPISGRGTKQSSAASDLGVEELEGNVTRKSPSTRKRQRKTYDKVRASRRLGGLLPELGMLPGRNETPPLHEASSRRQHSETDKGSGPGPRSSKRRSKKPIIIKSAKPQRISKKA